MPTCHYCNKDIAQDDTISFRDARGVQTHFHKDHVQHRTAMKLAAIEAVRVKADDPATAVTTQLILGTLQSINSFEGQLTEGIAQQVLDKLNDVEELIFPRTPRG